MGEGPIGAGKGISINDSRGKLIVYGDSLSGFKCSELVHSGEKPLKILYKSLDSLRTEYEEE